MNIPVDRVVLQRDNELFSLFAIRAFFCRNWIISLFTNGNLFGSNCSHPRIYHQRSLYVHQSKFDSLMTVISSICNVINPSFVNK